MDIWESVGVLLIFEGQTKQKFHRLILLWNHLQWADYDDLAHTMPEEMCIERLEQE